MTLSTPSCFTQTAPSSPGFRPVPSLSSLEPSPSISKPLIVTSPPGFEQKLSASFPSSVVSLTPSFSVNDLLTAATLSSSCTRFEFLFACKLISSNSSLPVDDRIRLLSQALLPTQIPDSAELTPLKQMISLERDRLINVHRKLTFDVEALCARFLSQKFYPLPRAPFNSGYGIDFYFEILNALNRWIESDTDLNKETLSHREEIKNCLERTQKLLAKASRGLVFSDSGTSAASASLFQSITHSLDSLVGEAPVEPDSCDFAKGLLSILNETKTDQEFWLPLTCLSSLTGEQHHVVVLRFHKMSEGLAPSESLWKVSLTNIGPGAIQPTHERNVCYDIEAIVTQGSINISAFNLLDNTFDTPQAIYEVVQRDVFNLKFELGKARETSAEALCSTQIWHVLLKDCLSDFAYSRFMSFWISEEMRPLYQAKLWAGHLGNTGPLITMSSPSAIPSQQLKTASSTWSGTPKVCTVPGVSEELYNIVMDRLHQLLRQHALITAH